MSSRLQALATSRKSACINSPLYPVPSDSFLLPYHVQALKLNTLNVRLPLLAHTVSRFNRSYTALIIIPFIAPRSEREWKIVKPRRGMTNESIMTNDIEDRLPSFPFVRVHALRPDDILLLPLPLLTVPNVTSPF